MHQIAGCRARPTARSPRTRFPLIQIHLLYKYELAKIYIIRRDLAHDGFTWIALRTSSFSIKLIETHIFDPYSTVHVKFLSKIADDFLQTIIPAVLE